MKALVLNGSPHKNGNTAYLISEFERRFPGEYNIVNAYDSEIAPCLDCRACFFKKGCVKKDGMEKVYNMWEESNLVILASPIYFSQLTGPLLSLASRFQSVWAHSKLFESDSFCEIKKQGVILLTGGGEGSFEPALSGAKAILSVLQAEFLGSVLSLNTDSVSTCDDFCAIKEMDACISRLKSLKI